MSNQSNPNITAPTEGGSRPELPQPGNYLLYCYNIILLGEVPGYQGKLTDKIMFIFEMPKMQAVFNEEKGPQPFSIHKQFTRSLHKQSNLRPFVEQWSGKKLNDQEAGTFNLASLIDIPINAFTIQAVSKNDKTYMDIQSLSPAYGIKDLPQRHNTKMIWTWGQPFNSELFVQIPLWIRNEMIKSTEFSKLGIPIPMNPDETWSQNDYAVVKVPRDNQQQNYNQQPQAQQQQPQAQSPQPQQQQQQSPQGAPQGPPQGPPQQQESNNPNPFIPQPNQEPNQSQQQQQTGQGSEDGWEIPE